MNKIVLIAACFAVGLSTMACTASGPSESDGRVHIVVPKDQADKVLEEVSADPKINRCFPLPCTSIDNGDGTVTITDFNC